MVQGRGFVSVIAIVVASSVAGILAFALATAPEATNAEPIDVMVDATTSTPLPSPPPESTATRTATALKPRSSTSAPAIRSTPTTAATPRQFEVLDNILDDPLAGQLDISASVRLENIGPVWELNPALQLFPASNQKLFTGAAALELLAAEHVFETTLAFDGTNLYLIAGGDPTLTSGDLRSLARQLAAHGIGQVPGTLVVDATRFEAATMAPGWLDWQIPTYVGPMSAFIVDDNRWTKDAAFLEAPALVNGQRFADLLREAGIQIAGGVELGAVPEDATQLLTKRSAPIPELVEAMMLRSDNEIAESLMREIGVVNGGDGSTAAGTKIAWVQLRDRGFNLKGANGGGSGLSRASMHSADAWTSFLEAIHDAVWFDDFVSTLPVAGRSGTLSGRLSGQSTNGNVRAKTGTIIGGRALSGYVNLQSGEAAVFSIIVNGDQSHLAKGLIDQWVTKLAELDLSDS